MKIDHDVLLLATRLVEEMGEVATRVSRVRLVELTAANNLRAAAFWRDVLHTSERLLAERSSAGGTAGAAGDATCLMAHASQGRGRQPLGGEPAG